MKQAIQGLERSTLKKSKKLIICCDGTWKDSASALITASSIIPGWSAFFPTRNPDEAVPTNVTRISRAIRPLDSDDRPQIVYYQAGVGTQGGIFSRLIAGATGQGLSLNIREAYSWLALNYVEGDEVYLIGFSRGAYTARSVSGLIRDFGLLTRDGLPYLLDIFKDWVSTGRKGYKSALAQDDPTFSITADPADVTAWTSAYKAELRRKGYALPNDVPIQAIGVWETVGALGIPLNPVLQRLGLPFDIRPYRFFDTSLSNTVKFAFQALALDERRSAYYPAVWEKPQGVDTTLKQTWFPGSHTGVSGGYKDAGLSNITLAWMMSQLAPFIDFDPTYLRKQFEANQTLLKQEKVSQSALRWAASQLRDSASGLRALIGVKTRTPGRYHHFDRKADRPEKHHPLLDTHEHIHYAVRSREATGGLDARNRITSYHPRAMAGYTLVEKDGEQGQGTALWTYVGDDVEFEGKQLPEDALGVFEKELFGCYHQDGFKE
ncbi:hypothetical protein LTR85_004756 [Meristemomyces frigidus]|nr:hypothetical protein LTR85_004756 [Meristemomyces frigidus]